MVDIRKGELSADHDTSITFVVKAMVQEMLTAVRVAVVAPGADGAPSTVRALTRSKFLDFELPTGFPIILT